MNKLETKKDIIDFCNLETMDTCVESIMWLTQDKRKLLYSEFISSPDTRFNSALSYTLMALLNYGVVNQQVAFRC